ncbi:alpha/beta fold hydrolase [Pseudonocardia sp. TRM90224]|uniref:alpha/beta fold hydrolase n=1 Tax=Pseudonocardia sp. TRM90224 TaxID=2812678 RepID=UPI001E40D9FD|nr:alpha/beta fold hydrolase [Pseudonocardia sp. TRM90224]
MLTFETAGCGSPIVFLYGCDVDSDSGTWRPIVERLPDGVSGVAVQIGSGQIGDGAGPAVFGTIADALRVDLDVLQVDRPVVVGRSTAAGLAMNYAARHPVSGVVIVDRSPWLRPVAEFLQGLAPDERRERLRQVFRRVFAPTSGSGVLERDATLALWEDAVRAAPDELQDRVNSTLAAVSAPVLALFGRELVAEERACLAHLPDVSVEEWPGRGDVVHLAEPDRFTERLLAFVGSCAA